MLVHRIGKRNLAMMVLNLLVAPLVIWSGTSDHALLPQYLGWCCALFLSLGAILLVPNSSAATDRSLRIPKFLAPLLMFLCLAGISCCWASIPWEGFFEWTKFAMCAIWIAVLLQMRPAGEIVYRLIPRTLLATCGLAVGYGYLQLVPAAAAAGGFDHQVTYQVVSFFAHRNLFAEAILVLFPFVFWMALKEAGIWRMLGLIVAFAAALLLLLLQVRSTWLGMAVEAMVALVGMGMALWKTSDRKAILRRAMLAMGVIVTAAALGIGVYSLNRLSNHPSSSLASLGTSIANTQYGSAQERILLWERTVPLIQERPLSGFGLGGWRVAVQAGGYRGMRMDMQLGKGMFVRAHNDFIQLAAETGLIGGIAWLMGILAACGAAWRIVRKDADTERRQFAVIPIMSLMGYVVISCFSFPMERISHLILLSTNLGLVGAMVLGAEGRAWPIAVSLGLRRALCVAGMLILLGFGYLGFSHVRADRHLLAALVARSQGNWPGMLNELNAGNSPFCTLDPTAAPYAWYAGSAKFQLGDAPGSLQAFQAAYRANPYHLHVLNNLGAAWVQAGQPDSGIVYCQKAIALSPVFSEASVNLAVIYLNQARLDLTENVLHEMPDSMERLTREQLIPAMVTVAVKVLLPDVSEVDLQNTLIAIANTEAWARSTYQKARENGRSLRSQLLLEAIFSLESQEKVITFNEAEMMRQKYAPH